MKLKKQFKNLIALFLIMITFIVSTQFIKGGISFAVDTPSNLDLKIESTNITVTWSNISAAYEYDIEIDGVVYSLNAQHYTTESYVHSGLNPCSTHTYSVRAVDINGYCSYWSNTVVGITCPMNPSYLDTTAYLNSIDLFWDYAPGAESYQIEADGWYYYSVSALSFKYGHLNPNTGHYFRIRSYSSIGGYSDWSKYVYANTLIMSEKEIQTYIETRKIVLSWNNISGVSSYDVVDENGTLIGTTSTSYFEHVGLNPKQIYKYRIGITGKPAYVSELVTVITAEEIYSAQLNVPYINAYYNSINEVELTWTSDISATKYEIERNGTIIGNVTNILQNTILSYLNKFDTSITNTYRVRTTQGNFVGAWSEPIVVLGIPNLNIISTSATSSKLSWKSIYGITSYDINIDGTVVNTTATSLEDVVISTRLQ